VRRPGKIIAECYQPKRTVEDQPEDALDGSCSRLHTDLREQRMQRRRSLWVGWIYSGARACVLIWPTRSVAWLREKLTSNVVSSAAHTDENMSLVERNSEEALESASPRIQRVTFHLLGEIVSRREWAQQYFHEVMLVNFAGLQGMIERARARGELRADVDTLLVMNMIGGPLFYHLVVSIFLPNQGAFPVERFVDLLWEGLKPRVEEP